MQSIATETWEIPAWGENIMASPIWWDFSGPRPAMIYPGCPLVRLSRAQLRIVWKTHPDYCYADDARRELMYRRGYCD